MQDMVDTITPLPVPASIRNGTKDKKIHEVRTGLSRESSECDNTLTAALRRLARYRAWHR